MHPKINRVRDDQKAKQTNILECLTLAPIPRFANILPHIESIVAATSAPRQDAEENQANVTEVIRARRRESCWELDK